MPVYAQCTLVRRNIEHKLAYDSICKGKMSFCLFVPSMHM
jgi:hypothetical protein